MPFIDAPTEEELSAALRSWALPEPPDGLENLRSGLLTSNSLTLRSAVQRRLATDWLYRAIRANIKRGPIFETREALKQRRADCLSYCKRFTILGRLVGVECGLVDVLMDPAGRYVPHTAVIVAHPGRRPRFIDLWYGSLDARHRRVGLRVRVGRRWVVRDVNVRELQGETVTYLPDHCADGITLYVTGNRHLKRGEAREAIGCYTQALRLYPESVRPHYNRAIAREMLGQRKRAETDYEAALRDDDALIRTTATEHEEITNLMQLDINMVDEQAQAMWVLRKGFVTGRTVPVGVIARRFGVSEAEVRERVGDVQDRLSGID